MKIIISIFLCFIVVTSGFSQKITDNARLAAQYYRDKEYEKAAVFYDELYRATQFKTYFGFYINCLIELKEYSRAERELRNNFKTTHDPDFLVYWGIVLHREGESAKGKEKYEEAILSLIPSSSQVISLSNLFIKNSEFEMAGKALLRGRELLPGEQFHYELARIYLYQRNYESMFEEYLALIKDDPSQLALVKSRLQIVTTGDIQDGFSEKMQQMILRKVQTEPNIPIYGKLLIWVYLQGKKFRQALDQAIAMDKRWETGGEQILLLSNVAGRNGAFDVALSGFNYLISKGEQSKYYLSSIHDRMQIMYFQFLENPQSVEEAEILADYDQSLEKIGKNVRSINLILDQAHLLAFYFQRPNDAKLALNEALAIPRLNILQKGLLKSRLADVMICNDEFWEASFLYAQVAEQNKMNSLGDEVKMKRARLAWYMGDIDWAHAQLDVLKASTSKTIANDAMDLSLLISENSESDSLNRALRLFARADLWEFRNNPAKSLNVLDSLSAEFPFHSLLDDVLFQKANLYHKQKKDPEAEKCIDSLLNRYPRSNFADDALLLKAKLIEKYADRINDAANAYKKLIIDYPNSIYAVEARKKFRILRGDLIK